MIGLSPSSSGAVQLTCAEFVAGRAITAVGAPGASGCWGVTGLDCAETGPPPLPLSACTVKRYVVPDVRPSIFFLTAGAATVVSASAVAPTYGVIR